MDLADQNWKKEPDSEGYWIWLLDEHSKAEMLLVYDDQFKGGIDDRNFREWGGFWIGPINLPPLQK